MIQQPKKEQMRSQVVYSRIFSQLSLSVSLLFTLNVHSFFPVKLQDAERIIYPEKDEGWIEIQSRSRMGMGEHGIS